MEIVVQGLEACFPSPNEKPAFTLSVARLRLVLGEIAFVVGSNGSGKTTLLRLISGELRSPGPRVLISDDSATWTTGKRLIPIVRQASDTSLALDLTVRENLILHRRSEHWADWLVPHKAFAQAVERALMPYPDIHRRADSPCRILSFGQRQTLAFIAATSVGSPLLLLDEFLSSADADTRHRLRQLTRSYATDNPAAVLSVTHDMDVAFEDGDRLLVMRHGKLVRDVHRGDPDWGSGELV